MRTRTTILIVFTILLMGAGRVPEAEAQDERFAVAAEGPELGAEITHLTGRAPFYQVYDVNGTPVEVVENIYLVHISETNITIHYTDLITTIIIKNEVKVLFAPRLIILRSR